MSRLVLDASEVTPLNLIITLEVAATTAQVSTLFLLRTSWTDQAQRRTKTRKLIALVVQVTSTT